MQNPFTIIIPLLSKYTLENEEEERDYIQKSQSQPTVMKKMPEKQKEKRSEMLYNKER